VNDGHRSIPTLQTGRLVLSAVTLNDVDAHERHFVDYQVIRFLSVQVPWPYPQFGVATSIPESVLPRQRHEHWVRGIRLASNPSEPIGVVHLCRQGSPENRGLWGLECSGVRA